MKELTRDYRIQILIRERGQSLAEAFIHKTEMCDDADELLEGVNNFILDTLASLEEGVEDEDK